MSVITAPEFIFTFQGKRVQIGDTIEYYGHSAELLGATIDEDGYCRPVMSEQIWLNGYLRIVRNPEVGMPATIFIGSDSYATEVVAITYFKEGKRAGEVKEIHTTHRDLVFRLNKWGSYRANEHYGLGLGFARDYRDPHF